MTTTRHRSRGGRPVVPAEAALSCRVTAACTPDQADRIRELASASGLRVSQYLVCAALRERLQRQVVPAELRLIWAELAPTLTGINFALLRLNELPLNGGASGEHEQLLELLTRTLSSVEALRAELLAHR